VQLGELLLTRLVRVNDHYEFSTVAAYLPGKEISGLKEKIEAARKEDKASYPKASYEEFMRRNNTILIHHALEQAELAGRPPVARLDPHRSDPPIQQRASHEKERIRRQRFYGDTTPHVAQTRRKAI
jgi:hypothetical protein